MENRYKIRLKFYRMVYLHLKKNYRNSKINIIKIIQIWKQLINKKKKKLICENFINLYYLLLKLLIIFIFHFLKSNYNKFIDNQNIYMRIYYYH